MKTTTKILIAGTLVGAIAATALTAFASEDTSASDGKKRDYSAVTFDMTDRVLEKTEAKVFTAADGTALNYREYRSPAYSEDGAPAAVFVFLHGSGGRGDDNVLQIADQIATVNFLVSDSAEAVLGDIPYIVLAPQCPLNVDGEEKRWVDVSYKIGTYSTDEVAETPYLRAVYELIQASLTDLNTDAGNVMLGGISMGGYGVWDLAVRHPEMFNAIFPICGGADTSKAEQLKGMKIWTFHCDGDTQVPVQGTRDMVSALHAAGVDVMYTEFNKNAHNAWMPAMTEETDPYLLEWLFEECMAYPVSLKHNEGGEIYCTEERLRKGDTLRVEVVLNVDYNVESFTVNGVKAELLADEDGRLFYEGTVEGSTEIEASFAVVEDSVPAAAPKGFLHYAAKAGIAALGLAVVAGGAALIIAKKKKKK